MGQYRFGTFTSPATASAQTIILGFVPSSFKLVNSTGYATNAVVSQALYYSGMSTGSALIQTVNSSEIPVQSVLTSNGFTTFNTGASFSPTILAITGISKAVPGVVTLSSIGSLANGDTVTISAVAGMTQVNGNRYIVSGISGNTFTLYDLYGNPVDTTGFSAYTSGGQVNIIATIGVAPVINPTSGQIINPGQPSGLVYDSGSAGIILGTGLFRNNADVFYWEARLNSPSGY